MAKKETADKQIQTMKNMVTEEKLSTEIDDSSDFDQELDVCPGKTANMMNLIRHGKVWKVDVPDDETREKKERARNTKRKKHSILIIS